jgi:hypothetical protein
VASNGQPQQQQQQSPDIFVIDMASFTMNPPPYSPSTSAVTAPPAYFVDCYVVDDLPPTYEQALSDESLLILS